jgi:hypothetical protein
VFPRHGRSFLKYGLAFSGVRRSRTFAVLLILMRGGLSRRRPQILHRAICRHNIGQILIVLFQLHKVGNVKEGIALQADVDEGGLHSR